MKQTVGLLESLPCSVLHACLPTQAGGLPPLCIAIEASSLEICKCQQLHRTPNCTVMRKTSMQRASSGLVAEQNQWS